MNIPQEILNKYHIAKYEDHVALFGEYDFYKSFLMATDYEMIKAFEKLFSEPTKFITNIVSLYKNYAEVIKWRMYAREQAEILEKELNI